MSKSRPDPRPRLGRGLSSLIPIDAFDDEDERSTALVHRAVKPAPPPPDTAQAPGAPGHAIVEIPLAQIVANPHQPRRDFDAESILDLAASMKSNGVIQPIIVRRAGDQFQLIAGERRWRAARQAGLATIPAIVRDVDSFTQAQLALVENVQRRDLNPIDRAQAYRMLMDQLGLTQNELALRVGEDRSGIANYLRLLDLGPAIRDRVAAGQISMGHGKLLAAVADQAEQERLAELVVSQDLSVRNLERLLAQSAPAAPARTPAPATGSAHLADLEKEIARQLGMRVQIRSAKRKGKGRIILHYATLDQFDELLARMNVKTE